MLSNLLGGFIVIVIGVNLIGPVADQVTAARAGNVTGAASTILGLTTIFFAMGIMAAGVSIVVGGLRSAGVL